MANLRSTLKASLLSIVLPCALLVPTVAIAGSDLKQPVQNYSPADASIANRGSPAFNGDAFRQRKKQHHRYRRAVREYNKGAYQEAQKSFAVILNDRPHDAKANLYMAQLRTLESDHEHAIGNYETALAYFVDDVTILAPLGKSYAKAGRLEEARIVLAQLETAAIICAGQCTNADRISVSVSIVMQALREI